MSAPTACPTLSCGSAICRAIGSTRNRLALGKRPLSGCPPSRVAACPSDASARTWSPPAPTPYHRGRGMGKGRPGFGGPHSDHVGDGISCLGDVHDGNLNHATWNAGGRRPVAGVPAFRPPCRRRHCGRKRRECAEPDGQSRHAALRAGIAAPIRGGRPARWRSSQAEAWTARTWSPPPTTSSNLPPAARSCSGGPCSTTRPKSMTTTRSASRAGPSRWDMSTAVRPAASEAKRSNRASSATDFGA